MSQRKKVADTTRQHDGYYIRFQMWRYGEDDNSAEVRVGTYHHHPNPPLDLFNLDRSVIKVWSREGEDVDQEDADRLVEKAVDWIDEQHKIAFDATATAEHAFASAGVDKQEDGQ